MDIIYFELNNWYAGVDYPADEPFLSWMRDDLNICFRSDNWCKQNKLCVVTECIDMSSNFCITAAKSWVEDNCPKLLTNYEQFLRFPDEDGEVHGRFGTHFLEYSEENFGVTWNADEEYDDFEEDDEYEGDE